jgi:predicted Zn-dependent protease
MMVEPPPPPQPPPPPPNTLNRPLPPNTLNLPPSTLNPPPVIAWPSPDGGGSPGRGAVLSVIGGVILAFVALTVVVALRSGSIASHPSARQLPPPIRDAVVLVPLGEFPVDRANEIAAREAADYGLQIRVAPSLLIDPSAIDTGRGQLTAERLIQSIAAAHPEFGGRTLVIGLTTQDIYIAGQPDWSWAFGLRNGSGLAIVSSARMSRSLDPGGEWNRLTKMVTRDIGFLYYGLEGTGDRGDVLYDNILSLEDLIRIGDHL